MPRTIAKGQYGVGNPKLMTVACVLTLHAVMG